MTFAPGSSSPELAGVVGIIDQLKDARRIANDPKLSDSRSWRAGCVAGERRRQEAASVTAERVRGMKDWKESIAGWEESGKDCALQA